MESKHRSRTIVEPARPVAGDKAERQADQHGDCDRADADDERDLAALDDAAQDVTAKLVGAHHMEQRGLKHPVGYVDLERIVRGNPVAVSPQKTSASTRKRPSSPERLAGEPRTRTPPESATGR